MAYRFGRSHWQDPDRLNLLTVCQEHPTWEKRLAAMREIYATANYPPGYFTENSCREELERIIALPTPNLRLDVSKTFVYSRKIMMGKWIEHFAAEVKKQKSSQAELGLVSVRSNVELMKEALDPTTSEERLQELMELAQQCVERNKNDVNFRRTVGSLDAAITERLKSGEKLDLSALILPPTKPPSEEDVVTGSRGFLTPTHSTPAPDMSFFSPPPSIHQSPLKTMAQAVREAAPVPTPASPEFVEPAPPVFEDLPDEIMEPSTQSVSAPSPVKSTATKKEKEEEPLLEKEKKVTPQSSPRKTPSVPASPKTTPVKKTPQKKREASPLDVKIEEIKEEEDPTITTPPPSSPTVAPTPRSRGRPRIHSNSRKSEKSTSSRAETPEAPPAPTPPARKRNKESSQEPTTSTRSRTAPKKTRSQTVSSMTTRRRKEDTPSSRVSSGSPEPTTSPPRKRNNESSQEPTSVPSKKVRNQTVAVPPMSTRRRKEDTPSSRMSSVPPIIRSESSLDFQTAPASPMESHGVREIQVQTDITIRQAVQEISIGERRRSNAPPAAASRARGRKSQIPPTVESGRSVSRNSSVSTPIPARSASMVPGTTRSIGSQTNVRMDIEKDELVEMRVDPTPNYFPTWLDLDGNKPVVVSFETCKEIDFENASLSDSAVEIGKRAAKVDLKREMSFIIDSDPSIGQRLIEEKSFQLVSASCDLPSAGPNDSPVKRRREDRHKEDNVKYQLLTMYRALFDCEWSEAFKKPVPLGEVSYDEGVLERIDLSMIKKEIDNGTISSVSGFLLRAYRMLSNALMYNGWDHDVHIHARNIIKYVMTDIHTLTQEESSRGGRRGGGGGRHLGEQTEEDSRTASIEPEQVSPMGSYGTKRTVFRKDPNLEGIMSASGSRKGKKSAK